MVTTNRYSIFSLLFKFLEISETICKIFIMLIKRCCGFVNLRPGLAIWALLELISAGFQFMYLNCEHCSYESKAVVGVDSIVGIVSSCLLLYGVIIRHKCATSLHLVSRILYMATSISSGILIFALIRKQPSDLSECIPQVILGVYLCGKFVVGFYFWLCVFSFYKTIDYYNIQWCRKLYIRHMKR